MIMLSWITKIKLKLMAYEAMFATEYAKKFNALCLYGGHHVDNDAKKIERFRDGLHGDLYEAKSLWA
jgi:hypothetical protein